MAVLPEPGEPLPFWAKNPEAQPRIDRLVRLAGGSNQLAILLGIDKSAISHARDGLSLRQIEEWERRYMATRPVRVMRCPKQ